MKSQLQNGVKAWQSVQQFQLMTGSCCLPWTMDQPLYFHVQACLRKNWVGNHRLIALYCIKIAPVMTPVSNLTLPSLPQEEAYNWHSSVSMLSTKKSLEGINSSVFNKCWGMPSWEGTNLCLDRHKEAGRQQIIVFISSSIRNKGGGGISFWQRKVNKIHQERHLSSKLLRVL